MNSHYIQLVEAKDADKTAVDISYEEFKDVMEGMIKNIKEFNLLAEKPENKLSGIVEQFNTNLTDHFNDYKKKYPEYAVRYDQEKQKPIDDAERAKRWDILEISASVLCCVPSYILLLCHCCKSCRDNVDGIECDDDLTTDNYDQVRKPFYKVYPGEGFFCRPIGTIKDKLADYKQQNEIIRELKSQAPVPQRM